MRTPFTKFIARVKCVLTRCDHLFTFRESQYNRERGGEGGLRTSHTSRLICWTLTPCRGFALFSSSTARMHDFLFHFSIIVVGVPMGFIDSLEKYDKKNRFT